VLCEISVCYSSELYIQTASLYHNVPDYHNKKIILKFVGQKTVRNILRGYLHKQKTLTSDLLKSTTERNTWTPNALSFNQTP
jgi:hypothetical protein